MIKKIKKVTHAKATTDGAGVPLNRVFGYYEVPEFDPFLMLDYFRTEDSSQAAAGFPWHPHRGIETISYMLRGAIEHEDSIGNKGIIAAGDVQWMTAGSGIIHQEMPQVSPEGLEGFQFWLNLPAKDKMIDPAYMEVKSLQIPKVTSEGKEVKLISGTYGGLKGPIDKDTLGVSLLDVRLKEGTSFEYHVTPDKNVFVFVYGGKGNFDESDRIITEKIALTFEGGDQLKVLALTDLRFILGVGVPLAEPVAWHGPVVMNTQEQLVSTFKEIDDGTFIKTRRK